MTKNLVLYCSECNLKQMSPMDMQRNPFKEEGEIWLKETGFEPDPNNPDNTRRVEHNVKHIQKPAMICSGCYADATETPTADPIYVGGKKQ